jgi:hypothetical protein
VLSRGWQVLNNSGETGREIDGAWRNDRGAMGDVLRAPAVWSHRSGAGIGLVVIDIPNFNPVAGLMSNQSVGAHQCLSVT